MKTLLTIAALMLLTACGGDKSDNRPSTPRPAPQPAPVAPTDPMQPQSWQIGPMVRGQNKSRGMPLTPEPHPDGWAFDFPLAGGQVNALTFVHGPLTGKSRITLRCRVEMEGVILPEGQPEYQSMLSLFFQRRGDSWSGRGLYEAYRWYSPDIIYPIGPGEHVLSIGLDEDWSAVMTSTARSNPGAFAEAIRDTERVGFVLGGGDGRAHGVYADGPARMIVTGFAVE